MSKQRMTDELFREQRRRQNGIQSDLLRIAALAPARSLLWQRAPWDNASRGDLPYRPAEKLQLMVRDVARTIAKHCPRDRHHELRAAITVFYETLLQDALAALPAEPAETEIVSLYIETKRESIEAECAVATTIAAPTLENFERAARENTEAVTALQRLRDRCYSAARKVRSMTPRPTHLRAIS